MVERLESIRNWVVSVIVVLTFFFAVFGGLRNVLVGSIEDAISDLETTVETLESKLDLLDTRLISLESKVGHIEDTIGDIRGDIKSINTTLYNHVDSRLSRIEQKLGINN